MLAPDPRQVPVIVHVPTMQSVWIGVGLCAFGVFAACATFVTAYILLHDEYRTRTDVISAAIITVCGVVSSVLVIILASTTFHQWRDIDAGRLPQVDAAISDFGYVTYHPITRADLGSHQVAADPETKSPLVLCTISESSKDEILLSCPPR